MSTTQKTQEQSDFERDHPPTKELIEMDTHELTFELVMANGYIKSNPENQLMLTLPMKDRLAQAERELGRRFLKGWIATGERKAGT